MTFSLAKAFRGMMRRSATDRPGAPRVRRSAVPRLLLECLEERCLLSYQVTDLGTLQSDNFNAALGINDNGQVVGVSYIYSGPSHAFVWDADNGMQDLGTLPGGRSSLAYGINIAGQVAG